MKWASVDNCRGMTRADGTVAAIESVTIEPWADGDERPRGSIVARARVTAEGGAEVTALVVSDLFDHGAGRAFAIWYDRYRREFVCTPVDCHRTVGPV